MAYQPGPKELQRKALREARFEQKNSKKPSASDLRGKIAKIKPMTKKGGGRGR